ncbi:MAG: tetratricopeptide repeat protein [Nitrospirota bacterium]|nr:tetratricopeptide repeat protein [Nitrospirota bacterium]
MSPENKDQRIRILVITSRPLLHETKNEQNENVYESIPLLDVNQERTLLREALGSTGIPVEMTFLSEATIIQVGRALDAAYDIVHYTGHGTENGDLIFESGYGLGYAIDPTAFRKLFSKKPKILFLSACHSEGTAREFFGLNIPCVIYLSEKISPRAAAIFCQHFYHSVIRGNSCYDAFNSAIKVVGADHEIGDRYAPKDIPTLKYSQRFEAKITPRYREEPLFGNFQGSGFVEILATPPNNVPCKIDTFIGRENYMVDIINKFDSRKIITIVAEPGMGKSELAKAVALWYLERNKFPGGIYWSSASDEKYESKIYGLENLIDIIIKTFKCDKAREQLHYDNRKLFANTILTKNPCLVVIDNFETIKNDTELWEFLRNIPGDTRVLLTSRESLNPVESAHVYLDRLSPDESVLLFLSILERTGRISDIPDNHIDLVPQIVELLYGWPLAIEVTAGQIVGSSLPDILDGLEIDPQGVLNTFHEMTGEPIGVWQRLWSSYQRLSEEEKVFFLRLSILQIPAERKDIEKIFGTRNVKKMLKSLVGRCLVKCNEGYHVFHPIIREFARDLFKKSAEDPCKYHLIAFDHYKEENPLIASNHLYICGKESDQVMRQFLEYSFPLVQVLRSYGLWQAAYEKGIEGITGSRKISDKNFESIFLREIGKILHYRCQWDEALAYYERSLSINHKLHHTDEKADDLGCIGLLYRDMGKMDEALNYLQEALKIHDKRGNRHGKATALGNIGLMARDRGNLTEAIKHNKAAAKIYHELGDRHGEAMVLSNLGLIYRDIGKADEALKYYDAALEAHRELGFRKDEADVLCFIGVIYKDFGKTTEALKHLEEALAIYRELHDSKGEAGALGNIGLVYMDVDRDDEALQFEQAALKILREIGYEIDAAAGLGNIGNIYRKQGKMDEVLKHLEEALAIYRKLGRKEGEANQLAGIGLFYSDLCKMDQAIDYHQKALEIHRELGCRRSEASDLINIGGIYAYLDDLDKALKYHEEALSIFEEINAENLIRLTKQNIENIKATG